MLALGGLVHVLFSLPVVAATPPGGVAVAVVQQAEADGATGQRTLQQDAPVYSGDAIVTGPIGSAQVKFRDDTKLVVGPNSRLVIDAFVFNDNDTARNLSINALKGAFRFISGHSRHDAYNITTPTATIGVRGTQIDVSVNSGVVVYDGEAEVCKRGSGGNTKSCVTIKGGCDLAAFDKGAVRKVSKKADRNKTLVNDFQYAVDQRPLLPEFRANTATCGVLQPVAPPAIIAPEQSQPLKVEEVKPAETPQPVSLQVPEPAATPTPAETPPAETPEEPQEPEKCDYHPSHHHHHHKPDKHWPDHHRPDHHPRGWHDGPHHGPGHHDWFGWPKHGWHDGYSDKGRHHRHDRDRHRRADDGEHHHAGRRLAEAIRTRAAITVMTGTATRTADDGHHHQQGEDRRTGYSDKGGHHRQGGDQFRTADDGQHHQRAGVGRPATPTRDATIARG